ncbi:MAG TPA: CCA tRNA nucleotidyltransferase [Myxococcales bacterium]|nr:CCA tRNA nucleotidyltransferase [Myxococcales bacterium]
METDPDSPLPEGLASASIPAPVVDVVVQLQERGHAAFLVGGCVRDLVGGRKPKDYDVATSATPEQVQAAFKKVIPTGIQHGTVTVLSRGEHVEVTTFRTEGPYVDGRRPQAVEFKQDIQDDLSRRDFTINAMAYDPLRRRLVDPFGGRRDLEGRVVRAVGDPHERFSEDGLRCLRAARFAATLGFQVEARTLSAITPHIPVFRKVANERVREELTRLLLSDHPDTGLNILAGTGLLQEIVPELRPEWVQPAILAVPRAPGGVDERLAAFLHPLPPEVAGEVLRRLTCPNKVIEHAVRILRHLLPREAVEWTDQAIRRWAASLGRDLVTGASRVSEAVWGGQAGDLHARIDRVLASRPPLGARELALNGSRIMQVLGVGPSPAVGEATRYLLDRVLENPDLNTVDGLTALLSSWKRGPGT